MPETKLGDTTTNALGMGLGLGPPACPSARLQFEESPGAGFPRNDESGCSLLIVVIVHDAGWLLRTGALSDSHDFFSMSGSDR
jgi:hypothetical protein